MVQNKKKNTAYQKKAVSEFQKGAGNVFTSGGSAAYQPRDANAGKDGQSVDRKKHTEKSMQAQQETFGQKVQKSKESQPGENSTFTENKSMDFQKEDTGQHKSKPYDAYIIPSGTEEYHYTKNGEEKSGVQFKFVMEFPKKKSSGGKKK